MRESQVIIVYMKKEFFDTIFTEMEKNQDIFFLTADLGWPRTDEAQKRFPDRFINCGASEQTMMDCAVGLVYDKKIPFTYTISPFYYRAWETIRSYIDREKLAVKMVSVGRNDDYSRDHGYSHDATDIPKFIKIFKNVTSFYPSGVEEISQLVKEITYNNKPSFLNISR